MLGVEAIEGTDALIAAAPGCAARGRAACWSRRPSRGTAADLPTIGRRIVRRAPPGSAASRSRPARASSSTAPRRRRRRRCRRSSSSASRRHDRRAGELSGETPLFYVVAGEPSGDALGGRLMAALAQRTGAGALCRDRRRAHGGAGARSPGAAEELAIMGVAEVLPRARRMLRRVAETVDEIHRLRPRRRDDRQLRLHLARGAAAARRQGERLPLIHYVAPMVWAWRAGRARRMARWSTTTPAALPFEPPYFTRVGLACAYVGHPVVESGADRGDGPGLPAAPRHPAERDAADGAAGQPPRRGGAASRAFRRARSPGSRSAIPTCAWSCRRPATVAEAVERGGARLAGADDVVRGAREIRRLRRQRRGARRLRHRRARARDGPACRAAWSAYRVHPSDRVAGAAHRQGRGTYAFAQPHSRPRVVPELRQQDVTPERLAAESSVC